MTHLSAQVSIGINEEPMGGAILQLKSIIDGDSNGDINSTQGLGFPRVKLTEVYKLYPMYETDTKYNTNATEKAKLDLSHTGLMVYNVGGTLASGMYYWDGTQWMAFESNISIPPAIASLLCENIGFDRQTLENGVYFETLVRVPYSGGNGAVYSQGSVINCELPQAGEKLVTGLQMQLQNGKLANGAGELIYRIWGTPNGDSPDVARFKISFPTGLAAPNDSVRCEVEIGNTAFAKIETVAVVGPLVYTEDNNVPGYGRSVTSPDGKWSVRAFVPKPSVNYATGTLEDGTPIGGSGTSPVGMNFEETDIQIRANKMKTDKKIMWSSDVVWSGGMLGKTDVLDIPMTHSDYWGGTTAIVGDATWFDHFFRVGPSTTVPANSAAAASSRVYYNVGWYNTNVFQSSDPENRVYTWTEIGVNTQTEKVKTVYTLTFLMGVSENPSSNVTPTNVKNSTVYLKLEQATSME